MVLVASPPIIVSKERGTVCTFEWCELGTGESKTIQPRPLSRTYVVLNGGLRVTGTRFYGAHGHCDTSAVSPEKLLGAFGAPRNH